MKPRCTLVVDDRKIEYFEYNRRYSFEILIELIWFMQPIG